MKNIRQYPHKLTARLHHPSRLTDTDLSGGEIPLSVSRHHDLRGDQ